MTLRVCSVAMIGILLGACATSPQQPQVALAASPVATSAPVGTAKRRTAAYYEGETRSGEKMYCQKSAPTGSNIVQKHCLTAEAMSGAALSQEQLQNRLSQPGSQLCPGCVQQPN
jgi:hypothetical protein